MLSGSFSARRFRLVESPCRTMLINAQDFSRRAAGQGVLVNAIGPQTLRAVTHLDVSEAEALRAAELLRDCAA